MLYVNGTNRTFAAGYAVVPKKHFEIEANPTE